MIPLITELGQGREDDVQCFTVVVVGIVNQQKVDCVQSEPLQALVDATQNTVARPVIDDLAVRRYPPSNLGREDILLARHLPQRRCKQPLTTTRAIQRRCVD